MSQTSTIGRGVRWAVGCLALMVLAALAFPLFARHKPPKSTTCRTNLKRMGLAFAMYCQDCDDRMPPARGWHGPSGLLGAYLNDPAVWSCPSGPRGRPHYGYNNTRDGVAGVECEAIAEPAGTIMCLDYDAIAVGILPPSRLRLSQAEVARHTDGVNCLFQDGHVMWLAAGKAAERRYWTRQADGPSAHLAP